MPIYVYKNLVTNETFEHEQRITEDALTVDPRTGDPVKRLIQPVGIAFKGSGFYVNDSRSSSRNGDRSSSSDVTRTEKGAGDGSAGHGAQGETSSGTTADKAATSASSGSTAGSSTTTESTPKTTSTTASAG